MDRGDWLTSHEAAERAGVSVETIRRLAQRGRVRAVQVGFRWWFDEQDVAALAGKRRRWVSYIDAANIVGCGESVIRTAVAKDRIEQRPVHRTLPSLDPQSVERFADECRTEHKRRPQRKPPKRAASAPPDNDYVWLDLATTALVLGLSPTRVSQLAQDERVPSVVRGRRRWFRRDHVEVFAAARASHVATGR